MTHINAFIEQARTDIAAAKAAVRAAEESLEAVVAKNKSNNDSSAPLPEGGEYYEPTPAPGPAAEGEAESKSKKVKYR